jgi:hypothetical protein
MIDRFVEGLVGCCACPAHKCGQICNRCEPRLPTVPVEGPTWVLDVTKDHG